jgi:nucleotidyltransferase/DNA polymerase involved in DNA repair
MARRLRLLGIRTLGQLANLPPSAVATQFGPDMKPLYRLARGQIDEPVRSYPVGCCEEARRQFNDPIVNLQVITAVLCQIGTELGRRLQATGMEGRELYLHLEMDDGSSRQYTLTLRRPTASANHLSSALNELCTQADFTCGITGLRVIIAGLQRATVQQLTLFNETAVSHHIHHTLQNLVAKYKTSRFYKPILAERNHPLPERRFRLQAIAQATV